MFFNVDIIILIQSAIIWLNSSPSTVKIVDITDPTNLVWTKRELNCRLDLDSIIRIKAQRHFCRDLLEARAQYL